MPRAVAEQAGGLERVAEVESHIENRRADDGFRNRLATSIERYRRILDRLAS